MRRSPIRWPALIVAVILAACAGPAGTATPILDPTDDVSTTASAAATQAASAAASASEAAADEHLVSIGDRSLWMECEGEGGPTVILESGLGGDHRTWERVKPALAVATRVCTYDRAGIGGSDPVTGTRTASDAVDDLAVLLESAAIEGPYVLVGFSFGGAIAQLYAATYPDDVAGIVLVESNHPLEAVQFAKHLTPAQVEEDRAVMLENPEHMDVFAGLDEVQAAGSLPNVPLVVVTAGISEGWPPGWDVETFDALRAAQQTNLATFTDNGRQVIAATSSHHVPSQEPETIVSAVEQVLGSIED
jgi:pimeloyl-ACP methyl ester carboxylesterase